MKSSMVISDDVDELMTMSIIQALAQCNLAAGQQAKAKNFLKFMLRMPWKHQYADAFERAWIMLAELTLEVVCKVARNNYIHLL